MGAKNKHYTEELKMQIIKLHENGKRVMVSFLKPKKERR